MPTTTSSSPTRARNSSRASTPSCAALATCDWAWPPAQVAIGRLTVNLGEKTAEVDGAPLKLTAKEYGVLELLALRRGQTVAKAQFLSHLYGGMDEPDVKIVDVYVCKLRQKIAARTGGENYIATEWGRGYVLREAGQDSASGSPGKRGAA